MSNNYLERIRALTRQLNIYRDEYYNKILLRFLIQSMTDFLMS